MALYAIGDVQGCDRELGALLDALDFSSGRDRLLFVGDLVNRGPDSLAVLRRVRALGSAATCVLGNHDLHFLAVALGAADARSGDTLDALLRAPDRKSLTEWLLSLPLLHEDAAHGLLLLHAGLPPQWDVATAHACARELELGLQRAPERLFQRMYGDTPDRWTPELDGAPRLRFIANCLTRLRYVDGAGRLRLAVKSAPRKTRGMSLIPWFDAENAAWRGPRVIFGHWSTLGFFRRADVLALDTGCVWGGSLTALRLDVADAAPVQIGCAGAALAGA